MIMGDYPHAVSMYSTPARCFDKSLKSAKYLLAYELSQSYENYKKG